VPFSRSERAWAGLAGLLVLASLIVFVAGFDRGAIDWQPSLAAVEPWRAWSAALVHLSDLHLGANGLGAVLVGALGAVARVPGRIVAAWFLAWPLTQAGLLAEPALRHYGGLSGVLHAGVACVAVHLVAAGAERRRAIGVAILAILVVKVISESPGGPPLRRPPGWDIAVAPIAHASGLVAGFTLAVLAEALHRVRHGGATAAP